MATVPVYKILVRPGRESNSRPTVPEPKRTHFQVKNDSNEHESKGRKPKNAHQASQRTQRLRFRELLTKLFYASGNWEYHSCQ